MSVYGNCVHNRLRFLGMFLLQPVEMLPLPPSSVIRECFLGIEAANANLFSCIFKNNYQITLWYVPFFLFYSEFVLFLYLFIQFGLQPNICLFSWYQFDSQVLQNSVCFDKPAGLKNLILTITDTISCCLSHSKGTGSPAPGICILLILYFFLEGILF